MRRPARAKRAAIVAALAASVLVVIGGCVSMQSPQASFSFENGRVLAIDDSGSISVYADLGAVAGWMEDPGSGADYMLFRQASTGCVVALDRLDVSGQRYIVAGDDASSTQGLVDATSNLNENRGLRGQTLLALNDTAASGNRQTVDALRIVYTPQDAGTTHHDAAVVRVFAGAGIALIAQASCDTDALLRAAMSALRRHVAFVVER